MTNEELTLRQIKKQPPFAQYVLLANKRQKHVPRTAAGKRAYAVEARKRNETLLEISRRLYCNPSEVRRMLAIDKKGNS